MYPFKLNQRFKKLSIFVLVPYIILCITAGGFHAFDKNAYHDHADNYHSENISQTQIRPATIHPPCAVTITVKTIVLSVNGSNIHRKRFS